MRHTSRRDERTTALTPHGEADAKASKAKPPADRQPSSGLASAKNMPQVEQPSAQVFVCRVIPPRTTTTSDAATQWKARHSPRLGSASAAAATVQDASLAQPLQVNASAAVEAANRSLANLERLVQQQHGQVQLCVLQALLHS
jgi:hypothetical protein